MTRYREVYPRVGGETAANPSSVQTLEGLSPRGRGNRRIRMAGPVPRRSIPAWAGKPTATCTASSRPPVYPRVGGETALGSAELTEMIGLSPRGRGNPQSRAVRAVAPRSIPAWAGKPIRDRRGGATDMVYPRVGGETRRP